MYQEAAMALRLVDDDLDVSLELPLDPVTREALGIQIQRCAFPSGRSTCSFESRLVEHLIELVDADLRPPTIKQMSYAIGIARSLNISVPGEALRFRGSMAEFLNRFSSLYRESLRNTKASEE
jgi:hypothetical protein